MNNLGKNKQLILSKHPTGLTEIDDFEVREVEVPEISDGEILIQTHYVGVDAALRLIVRDSDEFLFRVQPGDIIHANVAGKVIASNNSEYNVGEFVNGSLGVQNFAISDGSDLEKCNTDLAPLGSWLGGFGVSGLTAYFALFDECKPQPGQTVLVTGAAGAVGSMAGQLAKLAGARVIGTTSSAKKCKWLIDELGYDVAINYNDHDWIEQLEKESPNRINIIFDNTGGVVMNESLKFEFVVHPKNRHFSMSQTSDNEQLNNNHISTSLWYALYCWVQESRLVLTTKLHLTHLMWSTVILFEPKFRLEVE